MQHPEDPVQHLEAVAAADFPVSAKVTLLRGQPSAVPSLLTPIRYRWAWAPLWASACLPQQLWAALAPALASAAANVLAVGFPSPAGYLAAKAAPLPWRPFSSTRRAASLTFPRVAGPSLQAPLSCRLDQAPALVRIPVSVFGARLLQAQPHQLAAAAPAAAGIPALGFPAAADFPAAKVALLPWRPSSSMR